MHFLSHRGGHLASTLQILHRIDVHFARATVVHAQLPGVPPHPHVDHWPAATATRLRGRLYGSPLGERRRCPTALRVVRATDEPLSRLVRADHPQLPYLAHRADS